MTPKPADNLNRFIGWLCGAVFLAVPLVAIVYAVRHRVRPAVQAVMIGALSLPCLVAGRALMLSAGIQQKRTEWIALNSVLFVVFPLLASGMVTALSWPGRRGMGWPAWRQSRKPQPPHES